MIDLISIHIPKTAGTSFYNILQQVYGDQVSISYKRRDYLSAQKKDDGFYPSISDEIRVLHGHLYYREIKSIHYSCNAKVICWLRDPIDRIISNYNFFIRGLQDPKSNPENYKINKHRLQEDLITYARRQENINRMSDFLKGIALEDLFFIGLLESFETDLSRLASRLDWRKYEAPRLNTSDQQNSPVIIDPDWKEEIARLNQIDVDLYQRALELRS